MAIKYFCAGGFQLEKYLYSNRLRLSNCMYAVGMLTNSHAGYYNGLVPVKSNGVGYNEIPIYEPSANQFG